MSYASFKAEWNERRVDYDHVYGCQCVDEILEFLKEECNIASGVWGNAIDYAKNPTPTFVANFNDVTGKGYQQGDIVVLYGLAGNPYGHIGLFDHQDGAGIWLLEQNSAGGGTGTGKDAIQVRRAIPLSRVARVWRWKGNTPAPAPPPAARSTVFLPSAAGPWHLYHIGSSYNPNDATAVQGILRPDKFPPGLTYKIEAWVADNAVVITTQSFGRGVIWVKGTLAQIK